MTLAAGMRLGPYEVVGPLGAGGMGEVWRARDSRLGRDVAIKVVHRRFAADAEQLGRFEREARAVAALNHPNIIALYDVGSYEDAPFVVTELLEGESLRKKLGAPLPPKKAVEYAVQIAQGLSIAHEKGIVHRDLKPENLFVTEDERIKILDFGLAKLTQPSIPSVSQTETPTAAPETEPGIIMGTVGYMSPEQLRGQAVDRRSDIFSFGCVLYEMLGGRRAFGGASDAEALASLLRDTPKPIAGVPPGLMQVVQRCLAKEPAARYPSAADLGAALASCQAAGAAQPASVAVLPLANLGGGPQGDYLCEGLAEAIIGALTGIEGLRVIARTSAFAVARQGLDVREIGERLGVAYVLEGSLRRAGDRVRVSVRLVSAADGTDVWNEQYDHESPDVFALEDTISAAIASRLRGEGGGQIGRNRPAVDQDVRQAYLEGRYHFNRGGPANLARAKACFERAAARDPAFALAHDSLAEVYWFFGFFGVMTPREAFAQSMWHAVRALELDDSMGEAHALLGMLRKELDYNWPEVRREMRRALDLSSPSPAVRLRNAISGLLPLGQLDEAEAEVVRALDVDPLSIDARWWLACVHWLARRPERTAEIGRGMIELDPMSFWGHVALGIALAECGSLDAAMTAMERASEVSGGVAISLGFLGQFQGRAGRRDQALATLERLRQGAAGRYLPPFSVALIQIGLGDWDQAFAWMDRAIDERDPIIMPIKSFPFLDPVRSDPRYTALLTRMNLS
jgi:eukaryotic-like serine/threonine-protein kinase